MFWPAWRLVLERVATLQEVETYYSLDDVIMAGEALDLKYSAEKEARARAEAEAERKRKAEAS